MVIVHLTGGLGNQLFQYAAGRALATTRGMQLLLDLSSYRNDSLGREYRLNHFCISAGLATPADVQKIRRYENHHFGGWFWRKIDQRLPRHWRSVFVDHVRGFDAEFFRIRHSVILKGYWQYRGYLQPIEPMLRKELVLRTPPTGYNFQLAQEISTRQAVSVHVRRGDYVSNSSHHLLPLTYYKNAVKHMVQQVPQAHYYVFSDDVSWCQQSLILPGPATYVDHNGPDSDYEDLRLMSLCKHHIIANSSFSWWGAWLGQHHDQTVIAPKQWFAKWPLRAADRFPATWRLI